MGDGVRLSLIRTAREVCLSYLGRVVGVNERQKSRSRYANIRTGMVPVVGRASLAVDTGPRRAV